MTGPDFSPVTRNEKYVEFLERGFGEIHLAIRVSPQFFIL